MEVVVDTVRVAPEHGVRANSARRQSVPAVEALVDLGHPRLAQVGDHPRVHLQTRLLVVQPGDRDQWQADPKRGEVSADPFALLLHATKGVTDRFQGQERLQVDPVEQR